MKKIFAALEGGSIESQKKKKMTVTVICATIILIAVLFLTFLIAQGVALIKDKTAGSEGEGGGDGAGGGANAGYVAVEIADGQLHSGSLVLVNADNEYVFEDNPEVVSFPTTNRIYGLRDGSLKVNPTALSAFNELMTATYAAVPNANVVVREAYRSFEDQAAKHEKNPNDALPAGYSDFHTGMSFELQDGDAWVFINDKSLNGKYDWLYENAHKYGFIVRYPDNIPASDTGNNAGKDFASITGVSDFSYVFRYVGIAHATYIYNNELCLEEYLELLEENYNFGTALSVKGGDGKTYEVYYTTADDAGEIQVPSKYAYEISGNNKSGYIVTVNKSKTVKNTQ
ncbi:MAG: M15 family metallopeptidase [Clostridia bacterium]|nr:M15 family metallopeptidase [Clostridia bacterium]